MNHREKRRKLVRQFVGQEIVWLDEHNNTRGAATVVSVSYTGVLRVIEHDTLLYRDIDPAISYPALLNFYEAEYKALSQILRDEITYATSYGTYCGVDGCSDHRVFGGQHCADHEVAAEQPEYDPRENQFWDEATA